MTSDARAAVVREALTWVGTPYHSLARIKGVGVDCAQILCAVYEAVGLLPHVDPGHYAPDWHLHHNEEIYIEWLTRYCVRLPRSVAALPGDIALFRFGRCYSHGAILLDNDVLVHAYIRRGVIVTKLNEEPLAGRDVMYWTLR